MRDKSYYSLLCLPLALFFAVAAVVCLCFGVTEWRAVGLLLLAFFSLMAQPIWAHIATFKRLSLADGILVFGIGIGALFAAILALDSFSERGSNLIALVATLSPLIGYALCRLAAFVAQLRADLKAIAEFGS